MLPPLPQRSAVVILVFEKTPSSSYPAVWGKYSIEIISKLHLTVSQWSFCTMEMHRTNNFLAFGMQCLWEYYYAYCYCKQFFL